MTTTKPTIVDGNGISLLDQLNDAMDTVWAAAQTQDGRAYDSTGTAPAYVLTPDPAITAYAAGQRFRWAIHANGTTGSNTGNISGLGAISFKQRGGTGALVDGILKTGQLADVEVAYDGSNYYLVILNPLPVQTPPHGACVAVLSGGNLVLKPWLGNGLIIGGVNYTIPSTGILLAPTGLTPGTLYFVYAYMNNGAMTLEAATTGHATHTDGVEIKSGDASRTLVAMARPVTGPAFSATANAMLVRSWFNRTAAERRPRSLQAAEVSTTSNSYVEIGTTTRVQWLQWSDELVSLTGYPCVKSESSPIYVWVKLRLDGVDLPIGADAYEESCAYTAAYTYLLFGLNSGYSGASLPSVVGLPMMFLRLAEGYHYTAIQMRSTGSGKYSYLDDDSAKTCGNTEIVIESR